MNPPEQRTYELMYKYLDGAAGADEMAELRAKLQTQPAMWEEFHAAARAQATLTQLLKQDLHSQRTRRDDAALTSPRQRRRHQPESRTWGYWLAAACVAAVVLVFMNASRTTPPSRTAPKDVTVHSDDAPHISGDRSHPEKESHPRDERSTEPKKPEEAQALADAHQKEVQAEALRLEEQRQAEAAKEAQAAQERKKREDDLAAHETQAHPPAPPQAVELGQVVFLLPTTGDKPSASLRHRDGAHEALAEGLRLEPGDQIITAAGTRQVHVALKVGADATVELADDTLVEVLDNGFVRLDHGQVYAEAGKSKALVLKTAFGDVSSISASLDLRTDGKETAVQVAEGEVSIANADGSHLVRKLQRSVMRKDFPPGPPAAITANAIWRGAHDSVAQNLLANAGFEDGAAGWTLGKNRADIAIVPTAAHSGSKSLQLTLTKYMAEAFQEIPVAAGETYEFEAWGRSVNVTTSAPMTVIWMDNAGAQVGKEFPIRLSKTQDWTHYSTRYQAPAGAVKARIRLWFDSGSGTAWFDDCSVKKVAP